MKFRNPKSSSREGLTVPIIGISLASILIAIACGNAPDASQATTMDEPEGGSGAGGDNQGGSGSVQAGGHDQSQGGSTQVLPDAGAVAGSGGTPTVGRDAGSPDTSPPMNEGQPPGYVRSIMAVGYGGIRLLSRDEGLTWTKTAQLGAHGGDDENLLVSVAWGKGRWIATFTWKSWFSLDGITWKEFDPGTGCRGLTRVAFGNGIFVGTGCSPGESTGAFVSTDGIKWVRKGTIPSGFHTELQFASAEGKFFSWGTDNKTAATSTDGVTWTRLPGVVDPLVCDGMIKTAAACKGSFGGTGLWIKPSGGSLLRSTDGIKFSKVYSDDSGNYVPDAFCIGRGWSPPP